MKILEFNGYGSADYLNIIDVPTPEPAKGEVLIKIEAASINSWDWDMIFARPFVNRLIAGMRTPHKIKTLGCDIAGVIEKLGPGVTEYRSDDRVLGDLCASGMGAFAEYVCAPVKAICTMPEDLTFIDASALPQAGVMALQSLNEIKKTEPGERILINGAGGAVGTLLIQLARNRGMEVTAVDSREKLTALKELGATHLIDYSVEDFANTEKTYDLIIDVVAKRSIHQHRRALNKNGAYAMVGGTSKAILKHMLFGSFYSLFGSRKIKILAHKPNKDLDQLASMTQEGLIKPVIDSVYPFEKTVEALKHFGSNKFIGKIVIEMGT